MTPRFELLFQRIFLAAIVVIQPLLAVSLAIDPSPVQAATNTAEPAINADLTGDPNNGIEPDNAVSPDDLAAIPGDMSITNFDQIEELDSIAGSLQIGPDDLNALEDKKVDVRVTDYLTNLVMPADLGGYGLDHIKVNRIYKNYTSQGAGRFDREGVNAVDDSADVVSGHNRGQAVDISEVGDVTCKLVYEHHLGGNTTKFQKPLPVKVAWQSVDGTKANPTPTAQSILGAAGDMSAQSMIAYLNASGEMDYYVDYVKGMDLKTIVGYVGANVYLKTFGVNQVLTDPFADGLLHALGGAMLQKALPGIPDGISSGNGDDDARVAFAKSRIEQGLNLPPGSLNNYGWDNILQATGKRNLESSLGLPAGYFDRHTIDDAMTLDNVKTILSHFSRSDDSLNLLVGTVDAFKKKDANSFKMAGVTILESALHLSPDQKTKLETAVKAKQTPNNVALDGAPVGNTVSNDDLKNMFSSDGTKQAAVTASLKKIGLAMVSQAAQKAVKSKYSGLTAALLSSLIDPKSTVKLGDLSTSVGASTMGIQVGVNDGGLDKGKVDIKSFIANHAAEIAKFLNNENGLTDPAGQITAQDVSGLTDPKAKDTGLAEKLGAIQVDKAFGWNKGSTFAVINGKKSLADAGLEVFGNLVGKTLGLKNTGVSLDGNIQDNYGYALLADRLGIDQKLLKAAPNFSDLDSGSLGDASARRIFKINSLEALPALQADASFWDSSSNEAGWRALDITLGTSVGTVESYLEGKITTQSLARQAVQGSLVNFSADKIYDYFGLSSQYRLDSTQINALIKVFSGRDNQTLDDIQTARQAILHLLGRSVDDKADYSLDTFYQYIVAPGAKTTTDLLLDQGMRLVASSLGVNLKSFSTTDIQVMAAGIESVFGGGNFNDLFKQTAGIDLTQAEALRQEYASLQAVDPSKMTTAQRVRLEQLSTNPGLKSYLHLYGSASDILLRATGIPVAYRQDAEAFLRGDWRDGITAASFEFLLPQINQFMPANNQFTYADMRSAFVIDDPNLINGRVDQINHDANVTSETEDQHLATYEEARRELMEEAQKNIEYRMSDSLLRKLDPAIPVGFSQVMYSGSSAERGTLLENYVFGHLDTELVKLSPLYVPGMLKDLYEGKISQADTDKFALNLIDRSNISIGPFSNAFFSDFYRFLSAHDRTDFYTNTKYQSMWTFFDKWLGDNLSIGGLPDGLSKSVYYASQHGWNLDANLKNGNTVIVQSLNSLAKDFLVARLSSWGDKKFGLPVGSVYQVYTLTAALINADHFLAAAHGAGSAIDSLAGLRPGTTLANAQANYAQARAALILFAINLALGACKDCQAFFGSVDQAIAAPPGFTQALLSGLIANALGLGPTGIYIAAAIYLFGVYKVVYLCPTPPQDVWALTNFDPPRDQTDFGTPYANLPADPRLISASPAPGQNPFDWDNNVPFGDGNNQKIWMGWARYYVGRLIDATMAYGEDHQSPAQPLQVITYRQANAEFFAPRVLAAFGSWSANNDTIGLGFSQTSTKTTDWVHVGFGGLY